MKKIRVLIINPGPIYNVGVQWGAKLAAISDFAEGCFMSTSPKVDHPRYGGFDIKMVRSNHGRGTKVFLQSLANVFRLRGFDLIVAYDPLRSGLLGTLAAKLNRCPLIVEVNGVYTSPYVYDGVSPFRAWLRKKLLRFVMAITLSRASGIKLLFDGQLASFENILSFRIVRAFPNYVDVSRFRNIEERKEILCVGSPFFLKGMDVLVAAFKEISDDYPDWTLKLLGWFPNRSEVDQAIGNHPRILVHPPVPAAEIPDHIGRCGIFVLPSRTEAMGRVLVEAMASGKPRIGSNVDGIPTVISDGIDGLLSAPGDKMALAECLVKLLRDESLRRRLGQAASARAEREFNSDAYCEQTRRLYEDVLSAAGK